MANTNSGRAALSVSAFETGDAIFGASPKWGGEIEIDAQLLNGVVAGGFDLLYMGERTVASASNDDIDVAGTLTSALGETMAAVEIVGIFIINAPKSGAANTTNLTVGGATAPVAAYAAAGRAITPGGFFAEFSPGLAGLGASGVTATTGDDIRVANSSGASNTYQIAIFGRTA